MASIQIAQNVVREKGQRTCAHHRGQLLILYCETCDDVMCIKCISSIHKSHTVCDLSEVIPAKKTELQNYLDKNNRAQIKQDADFTEIEMKKNVSNFDSLCRDVQAQSIKLKQAVDTKTEQVLSACKEMKEGNIKALKTYRRELHSRLEYFDDDFQAECAAALRNGSDLQVHDTLEEVRAKAKVPLIPILGTASFNPNTNPQSFMDRYFGTLTTSTHRPPQIYKFLPEAIEQSCFGGNNHDTVTAIATTSASEVWVCYQGSMPIKLLNVNGVIQQTIPWELPIVDACISPTTQNLWVCTSQNGVYELDVSMESPESLLRKTPSIRANYNYFACICVTMDDQVLVDVTGTITKYTKSGRALISTQYTQGGRSLVPNPKKITECSVTRNVAAISYTDGIYQHCNRDMYQDCSVVVMNSNLEQIFRSNGAIPEGQRQEININSKENMTDIQFDTAGNLIIARQTYFLILSGIGEFLTIIKTSEHRNTGVLAFSLDKDGFLWAAAAARYGTLVKRLQYCRKS